MKVKDILSNCVLSNILTKPAIYLLKVNNINTRIRCEICSKLTIKTPERRQTYFTPYSSVYIVNFEHVTAGWELSLNAASNIKEGINSCSKNTSHWGK